MCVVELEKRAGFYWDEFYKKHENRFFKNRNWLFTEFPELEEVIESSRQNLNGEKRCVLEIGCGVGNTVFPILNQVCRPLENGESASNEKSFIPNFHIYACDFSHTAVELVKSHEMYDKEGMGLCTAFQCDFSSVAGGGGEQCDNEKDLVGDLIKEESLDVAIMIFVLSAISPERMQFCIDRVSRLLKPGGRLLFRDYGRYDLAQLRFKKERFLKDNFYVRGDGTRVYFFAQEEVREMCESAGLVEEQNMFDKRLIVNRGKKLKMYRSWLQCKYVKRDR